MAVPEHIQQKVAALAKEIAGLVPAREILNAVNPEGAKFLWRELKSALASVEKNITASN